MAYSVSRSPDRLSIIVPIEKAAEVLVGDDVFENVILFAKGAKFFGGEEVAALPAAVSRGAAYFKNNLAVEVFVGKRAEENFVGDAEDNRGRANAESQRVVGDEREAKMITDVTKGVPNVANGAFEVGVHRETVHPARVDFQEMLRDCRCARHAGLAAPAL